MEWHGDIMVCYGMVRYVIYGTVRYDIVRYGMLHGMWYGMVQCGVVWYGIVWYGTQRLMQKTVKLSSFHLYRRKKEQYEPWGDAG